MKSSKQTTIMLSGFAAKIKDELAPIFGFKNIVEASLNWFYGLSNEDRIKAIQQLNENQKPETKARTLADIIGDMDETTLKMLNEEDSAVLDRLRAALGPEKDSIDAQIDTLGTLSDAEQNLIDQGLTLLLTQIRKRRDPRSKKKNSAASGRSA